MSTDDEIAALEHAIAQKRARLVKLESLARTRRRTADTRRKILTGAIVLDLAKHSPEVHEWLRGHLEAGLSRQRDRDVLADQLAPFPPPDSLDQIDADQDGS